MATSPTDRNFRLPEATRPVRHDAFLSIDPEARTFHGRIRIGLSLDAPAEGITLHAAGLRIGRATVRSGGVTRDATVAPFPASETVLLSTGTRITAGPAEVEVEWTGTFSAGLRGLYRAGPLSATQFEAADARRVFPCLDEPGFKAPWALTLEVPRGRWPSPTDGSSGARPGATGTW